MDDHFQLCPHCDFQSLFDSHTVPYNNGAAMTRVVDVMPDTLLTALCCRHCKGFIIRIARHQEGIRNPDGTPYFEPEHLYPWKPRPPKVPEDVPKDLREAYEEAWALQNISECAAAVMARRCLQLTLRKQGFVKRTLDAEIEAAEATVGADLATQLHYVRTVGNIGAHPMDAEGGVSFEELLNVQPGELVALFAAIREAFEEFFVKPARKKRDLDALNAKLKAAGKPPLTP